MSDFRDTLKPGDKVITDTGYVRSVETVEKITKHHIILAGSESKWHRRRMGRVGSGTWDRDQLREATPQALAELREQIRRGRLVRRIEEIKWSSLPTATLTAVVDLVAPSSPEGGEP